MGNIKMKKSRLIITTFSIAVVVIAVLSTIFKEDIPAAYYSILYGNSINVGNDKLKLDESYFFLSDNKDIKNIGVSSKKFIKRTPIVVVLPHRANIHNMVEQGKLIHKVDVSESCKLYKFVGGEEYILFNLRNKIGYSVNEDYSSINDQKSICNILN
jgi:hypothetical protein